MSPRLPCSTYRLQLHAGFGFHDAARVMTYLQRLGITDVYVSPILKATPGSTHGYDVIDHDALNPELGGPEGFEAMSHAAAAHGLGLIVDFVPNHMGVGAAGNRFWEDVLEHGQASERANYFDIDWLPPKETLAHKLLVPILPDQYGVVLESGYFKLIFDGRALRLCAGTRPLPLRPQSIGSVLRKAADLLEGTQQVGPLEQLRELGRSFSELVEGDPQSPSSVEEYRRSARLLAQQLCDWVSEAELESQLNEALALLGGTPGQPESFDFLDQLLRAQHYRLSAWQLALEAVNYRRFFDVTDLASIRIERPEVFDDCHRLLFSLIEQGKISGIRLDHIDGLFDPIGYLRMLSERLRELRPDTEPGQLPLYLLVEKILAPDEVLPPSFRAHGTTGYEFLRVVSGLFVDRRAESNLSNTYRRFSGDTLDFEEHVLRAKRDVLGSLLASDANMLSRALERIAEEDRRWRDLTFNSLQSALIEVIGAFSAYRSYVRPDGSRTAEDEALINRAVATAIRRNPTAGRGAFQFLRSLLLGTSDLPGAREFAMRFQQTTGPVTAKALEDTAFYRYSRNLADNDVGCRPDQIGVELAEFHAQNALEQSEHRLSLTATSTHDTKRGEDARARLSMLSELPNTWRRTAHELRRIAGKYRVAIDGNEAPARGDEYFYYQSLIGVVPFGASESDVESLQPRLVDYMQKACREAKLRTSWLHPHEEYEQAVREFVIGTLADPTFVAAALRFCRRIDPYAASKALAQVTLKLCSPGVPDTYQGSEIWHQVLVDPDNRRAVDYSALEAALASIEREPTSPSRLLEQFSDGRLKLFIVQRLLQARRDQPDLFRSAYAALEGGSNVVGFGRGNGRCDLVCAVTRFPFRATRGHRAWAVGECWADARLTGSGLEGDYRNLLTGQTLRASDGGVSLSELFSALPVAVLGRC